MSKIHELN